MDTKELRKLSRREILEILLEQTKRIEELEEEIESLKVKLNEKKVSIAESGTLAMAALKLGDVFKAADDAIAIYMDNIKDIAKKEERKRIKEWKVEKAKLLEKVEKKCLKREQEAEQKLKMIEEKIKKCSLENQKNVESVKVERENDSGKLLEVLDKKEKKSKYNKSTQNKNNKRKFR